MAEVLRAAGREVIYVTPDDVVASWTTYTQEYRHVQKRLHSLGMEIVTAHNIVAVDDGGAQLVCVYSGRERRVSCASIVAVTARLPNDSLQQALEALSADWRKAGIEAVTPIGDCYAPGLIVHAVYAGHRYARELDEPAEGEVCFRRRASEPPMS
jgi:dimethylamine/trimethylamine dehydrogenase